MPRKLAQGMVASLVLGDDVELPGLYEELQFESGFLFEWLPTYYAAQPQFALESLY